MKKLAVLSLLCAAAGMLNVGCSASASVRKADATRTDAAVRAAYTTAPAK